MVLFWKIKKSIYCWTRSRPTWTFGESDDQVQDKSESKYQRVQDKSESKYQWVQDKSESKYQWVQDKSETIEKRLESGLVYYSPSWGWYRI